MQDRTHAPPPTRPDDPLARLLADEEQLHQALRRNHTEERALRTALRGVVRARLILRDASPPPAASA